MSGLASFLLIVTNTWLQRSNYNYLPWFFNNLISPDKSELFLPPRNQSCVGVPFWPNKMIDFPQFGSARNFIKPGHWLWVNQRQDDDDLSSPLLSSAEWYPELCSSAGPHHSLPGTKRIKHFNQRQLPTFDRRTRLLVILEQWSHSILSIEQNIKSMHEIKCWPSRRIVVINFKVDFALPHHHGHCRGDQGSRGGEVIQDYCLHR